MYYTEKIDAFIMKQTEKSGCGLETGVVIAGNCEIILHALQLPEITGFGGVYENISNWISKNWNIEGIKVCFGEVFQKGNRSRETIETCGKFKKNTLGNTEKCRDRLHIRQRFFLL